MSTPFPIVILVKRRFTNLQKMSDCLGAVLAHPTVKFRNEDAHDAHSAHVTVNLRRNQ